MTDCRFVLYREVVLLLEVKMYWYYRKFVLYRGFLYCVLYSEVLLYNGFPLNGHRAHNRKVIRVCMCVSDINMSASIW